METFEELDNFYSNLRIWSKEQEEKIKPIVEMLQTFSKSLYASDTGKTLIAFQKALNDPDSAYNQAMRNWSFVMQQYDLSGIDKTLEQVWKELKPISNIDFKGLKQLQNLDFSKLYGNVAFDKSFSEAVDLAYEVAKQEAGEPDISKEEIEEQVREKIDTYGIDGLDVDVSNNGFKEKFIKILKIFFVYILLPLILNTIYDLGKVVAGSVIKSDANEKAAVIYEITNQETYVNIIEQTENYYHIYFINEDGNVIDGYLEQENIDLDLSEE